MTFTREQVEAAVKSKGYAWFDSKKDYDVNIVGIRNAATGARVTNMFDDWMTVSYKVDGKWNFHIWPCTTDPGTTYTQRLLNPDGVARLVEGQYRGAYQLGLHQGKYRALVQRAPVKVWRDKNKDLKYDQNLIQEGLFGINIHRASSTGTSTRIDGWSAGCQVFSTIGHFNKFLTILSRARDIFGNKFTYTLINSNDIK